MFFTSETVAPPLGAGVAARRSRGAPGRGAARGSAITEFMICLFPYMIILLGAIFFWHIALGKQELFDYSQAAAATGDADKAEKSWTLDGARRLNAPRQYAASDEASYNAKVGVDPKIDEPVLPYAANGEDFKACVSRGVYNVTANADGTIDVSLSHRGHLYLNKGIIKNVKIGNHLSANANLDFDVDEEIAAAVSRALGEWISYSGVDGGAYRFTLQFGASDNIALERGSVTDNWRSQSGVTVGGRSLSAFTASIVNPRLRPSENNRSNVLINSLDDTLHTDLASVVGDNVGLDVDDGDWYSKYPSASQGGNGDAGDGAGNDGGGD